MDALGTFLSVSRFHIVAIAALGTFTFGWLFTGHYPWVVAALCALDWFVVNLLNRVVDLGEDAANKITGVAFVDRHKHALVWLGFALLFGSLAAAAPFFPIGLTLARASYHALGLSYNWPLLPGRRRLKQVYFWKNTASAFGFMLTVFVYPLTALGSLDSVTLAPGITTATIVVTGLYFFLFELSYEVIYDLRDEPGDRQAGVMTYPVVHGLAGATRIIDGLIVTSLIVLAVGYALEVVPWRIFVMILGPLMNLFAYKRFLKRGITSRDCVNLTWLGAGLLIAYHLWVVAGLPGVGLPEAGP